MLSRPPSPSVRTRRLMSRNGRARSFPSTSTRTRPDFSVTNSRPLPSLADVTWVGWLSPSARSAKSRAGPAALGRRQAGERGGEQGGRRQAQQAPTGGTVQVGHVGSPGIWASAADRATVGRW